LRWKSLHIWLYLGALGLLAFLLLRPAVDFNAGAPIHESRSAIEQKTLNLAEKLGMATDSLQPMAIRQQYFHYYNKIREEHPDRYVSPAALNRQGINLSAWSVTLARPLDNYEAFMMSEEQLFERSGDLRIVHGNDGHIMEVKTNPQRPNPTFVSGDSLFAIANSIVGDLFGYDLSRYELSNVQIQDSLQATRRSAVAGADGDERGNRTELVWKRKSSIGFEPEELRLAVTPVIQKMMYPYGTRFEYGLSVDEFTSSDRLHQLQAAAANRDMSFSLMVFYGGLAIMVGLVFFVGFRQVFRGQVDWSRALVVLSASAILVFGWRVIHLLSTYGSFLGNSAKMVVMLNTLIFGLVCGLYFAMAYIGWEALARKQQQAELMLIDAFWRRRLFFRETGQSLIRGYALGGILLGLFATILYTLHLVFLQSDGFSNFAEASNKPQLLTINMSALITASAISLGHVGVIFSFLKEKIKKQPLLIASGIIIIGFLMAGLIWWAGTNGRIYEDFLVFTALAVPLVYAFKKEGLVTIGTGLWVMTIVLMITPFWGSPSLNVAMIGWIQLIVLLIPLIFGFFSYHYGNSVAEMEGYVPEYEERLANHLRVEKEIEIARESQFKLMPLQAPVVPGIDIYGFFLPSFEVGGDYFDYVVNTNGNDETDAVTFTVVDVSGKAMKAAMHAVFTSGLLLSRMRRDEPSQILDEISPTIYQKTDPKTFITCLIGRFTLSDRRLMLANAGHCLPLLKREGKAEFIRTPDPRYPLGVQPKVCYQAVDMQLKPGDFLLFYSDGLPEAINEKGERFGYENLPALVEELDTQTKSSQEIAVEIKRRIQKFSDYQLADDTTLICLKV